MAQVVGILRYWHGSPGIFGFQCQKAYQIRVTNEFASDSYTAQSAGNAKMIVGMNERKIVNSKWYFEVIADTSAVIVDCQKICTQFLMLCFCLFVLWFVTYWYASYMQDWLSCTGAPMVLKQPRRIWIKSPCAKPHNLTHYSDNAI